MAHPVQLCTAALLVPPLALPCPPKPSRSWVTLSNLFYILTLFSAMFPSPFLLERKPDRCWEHCCCFSRSFPPSITHLRQWQASSLLRTTISCWTSQVSSLLSKTTSTLRPNCRSFEIGVVCLPPQVLAQGSLSSSPLLVLSFLTISTSTQMIH